MKQVTRDHVNVTELRGQPALPPRNTIPRMALARAVCGLMIAALCALVPALSQADARQGEARIEAPIEARIDDPAGATGPRAEGALDLPPAPPLVQLPTRSEWSGWTPACRATLKQLAKAALVITEEAVSANAGELEMLRFIQDWGIRLDRIRQDDPEEARRQRLPMPLCRASAFAPLCDDLTDVFAPVAELEPASPVSKEDAP